MSCEIKQSDVIRLILQFLKEANLPSSFKTLQEESQISLNLLENKDIFLSDIKHGRWEQVLKTIKIFRVPSYKLISLYEQILYELMELGEWSFASDFFKETIEPLFLKEFPEKCHYLSNLLRKSQFNYKETYASSTKDRRRAQLAELFLEELTCVPPSRLLILLGQAIKYQENVGDLKPNINFDIFTNKVPEYSDKCAQLPTTISKKLVFSSGSRVNSLAFSPNGQSLFLGAADGIIEVWDPVDAKIRKDLVYQSEEMYMLHEAVITALSVSKDNELLASGDKSGLIKVWRVNTGKCLRKLQHSSETVSFLSFGKEPSHLFSAASELKVFGLKSGRVLKEFRGNNQGFINDVNVKEDKVFVGGKDGVLRIFEWGSCECVMSFRVCKDSFEREITNILEIDQGIQQHLVVCNRNTLALVSSNGAVLRNFDVEGKEFACACVSLKGEDKGWVYAAGFDNVLYCFNYVSGKIESFLKFAEKNEIDIIGIKHHPKLNLVVLWSLNGVVLFLTPA